MKVHTKMPLKFALYGMDARTVKTMEMYLKGPCRGVAIIVDEAVADADMIDADHPKAKELLDARKSATPNRPVVLLSLQILQIENTFFIRKPATVEQIFSIVDKLEALLAPKRKSEAPSKLAEQPALKPVYESAMPQPPKKTDLEVYLKKPAGTAAVRTDDSERQKSGKQQSALQLNEGGFTAFLGTLPDVDFDDEAQLFTACFDARQYVLGYLQSAYKTAWLQSKALLLCSIWKPITILPETSEIWVDADDKQLRAFAGVFLNKGAASMMSLSVVDVAGTSANRTPDKLQDMNAFIWKVAIWTSKGRFPIGLDIQRPVYLEHWPNFTRLVITPDALRIAALLVQGPRSPLEVAAALGIKPQYVFVFVSACHVFGILGQSQRAADTAIANEPVKKPKNEGLLRKILGKLRGA